MADYTVGLRACFSAPSWPPGKGAGGDMQRAGCAPWTTPFVWHVMEGTSYAADRENSGALAIDFHSHSHIMAPPTRGAARRAAVL